MGNHVNININLEKKYDFYTKYLRLQNDVFDARLNLFFAKHVCASYKAYNDFLDIIFFKMMVFDVSFASHMSCFFVPKKSRLD